MKVLFGLFVIIGLALGATYYFGGFATMDPETQQKELLANVNLGMDWKDVVDYQAPRKVSEFAMKNQGGMKVLGKNVATEFKKDDLNDRVTNNKIGYGFVFTYKYSGSHITDVEFDTKGKVVNISHPTTMKDLLNISR
ncbi:hypothetical protein [Poriferisphaera sp. WC338]|uniref:hypothetical protein n=1 Tax=Poriferisphaera sp. WC338 TaxID=3425129 RepID=UPI003D81AAEB